MGFDLSLSISSQPQLELVTVYRAPVAPPSAHSCRPGNKRFERFFYVSRGKIIFSLPDGSVLEVPAGNIAYLPCDCTYESRWDEAEPGEYITVNFIRKSSADELISFGDRICLLVRDQQHNLLHSFLEILQYWQSDASCASLKCYSVFYDILYQIGTYLEHRSIRSASREIYKGVLYLENNYLSDVSVEELAQMCAVSVCTFRRLFKQLKGMSPISYRNSLRMKKARMLLQSGEYSVTDVSAIVQCANIYYFSRMFKSFYGISPSECRPE